jgi:acyl-coenzyme A synthetase/AMP-(fatty) acid ligase
MIPFGAISRLLQSDRPAERPVASRAEGTLCWADFRRAVGRLAARLEEAGGKRWLIATDDACALAVALLAVLQTGGRVLLPANLQAGHLAELAGTADGVLVHPAGGRSLQGGIGIFSEDDGRARWRWRKVDANAAEVQLHTSGTTGRPEPVIKPLRCLEAEVEVLESVFRPEGAQAILATVPAYHIYGLLFRVLWPLSAGRLIQAEAIAFPEELTVVAEQKPAPLLVSSPAFLWRALPMLDLPRLSARLCGVFSSGGPLEPAVAAAYNAGLACGVVEVYGSTETGGIGYRRVRDPAALPPWRPMPGVRVTLSEGEGVLTVTSPFLPTAQPFETGDRGSLLPDGCFRLEGRKDRIVKLEERRVSLLEIEERLRGWPQVEDARVIALAAAGARTALGAVVVPSEAGWAALAAGGGKRVLRRQLHGALKPHIEALALPRRWRFVRRLPVSPQGKTTAASLVALFQPSSGHRVDPEAGPVTADGARAEIVLRPQQELVYFDGHFDAAAILPGVVQVDWAVKQARRHFAIPGAFQRIEALKFFHVLPAGAEVTLVLAFDADKARLSFSYQAGAITHSSGRIRFGAAP